MKFSYNKFEFLNQLTTQVYPKFSIFFIMNLTTLLNVNVHNILGRGSHTPRIIQDKLRQYDFGK